MFQGCDERNCFFCPRWSPQQGLNELTNTSPLIWLYDNQRIDVLSDVYVIYVYLPLHWHFLSSHFFLTHTPIFFFNIIYFAFHFSFSSTLLHFLFLFKYWHCMRASVLSHCNVLTNLRCLLCFFNNALFLNFSHFITFALCYSLKAWIKIYGHTSSASHRFVLLLLLLWC